MSDGAPSGLRRTGAGRHRRGEIRAVDAVLEHAGVIAAIWYGNAPRLVPSDNADMAAACPRPVGAVHSQCQGWPRRSLAWGRASAQDRIYIVSLTLYVLGWIHCECPIEIQKVIQNSEGDDVSDADRKPEERETSLRQKAMRGEPPVGMPALGLGPENGRKPEHRAYHHPAAGWGAAKTVGRLLAREGELIDGPRAIFRMNHEGRGFDCPGCAWPDDTKGLHLDICENGIKHVAWEMTHKRVGRQFFTAHSVSELMDWSDFALEDQGRLKTA
jgi:hypothetical protein